jgi:hypothetical protein
MNLNIIKSLKNSMETRIPFLAKSAIAVNTNWSDIINLIDFKYNEDVHLGYNKNVEYASSKAVQVVDSLNNFKNAVDYPPFFFYHLWDIVNDNNPVIDGNFLEINDFIKKYLNLIIDGKEYHAKASISLVSNGKIISKHTDSHHSLFIGLIGDSIIQTTLRDFVLCSGDILMLPESIEHSVKSNKPRASIIFDILLD